MIRVTVQAKAPLAAVAAIVLATFPSAASADPGTIKGREYVQCYAEFVGGYVYTDLIKVNYGDWNDFEPVGFWNNNPYFPYDYKYAPEWRNYIERKYSSVKWITEPDCRGFAVEAGTDPYESYDEAYYDREAKKENPHLPLRNPRSPYIHDTTWRPSRGYEASSYRALTPAPPEPPVDPAMVVARQEEHTLMNMRVASSIRAGQYASVNYAVPYRAGPNLDSNAEGIIHPGTKTFVLWDAGRGWVEVEFSLDGNNNIKAYILKAALGGG
jgi:hypothetical protein